MSNATRISGSLRNDASKSESAHPAWLSISLPLVVTTNRHLTDYTPFTSRLSMGTVHAHRLLRYSLHCIVEVTAQIYTSVAAHLSARCPLKTCSQVRR